MAKTQISHANKGQFYSKAMKVLDTLYGVSIVPLCLLGALCTINLYEDTFIPFWEIIVTPIVIGAILTPVCYRFINELEKHSENPLFSEEELDRPDNITMIVLQFVLHTLSFGLLILSLLLWVNKYFATEDTITQTGKILYQTEENCTIKIEDRKFKISKENATFNDGELVAVSLREGYLGYYVFVGRD